MGYGQRGLSERFSYRHQPEVSLRLENHLCMAIENGTIVAARLVTRYVSDILGQGASLSDHSFGPEKRGRGLCGKRQRRRRLETLLAKTQAGESSHRGGGHRSVPGLYRRGARPFASQP